MHPGAVFALLYSQTLCKAHLLSPITVVGNLYFCVGKEKKPWWSAKLNLPSLVAETISVWDSHLLMQDTWPSKGAAITGLLSSTLCQSLARKAGGKERKLWLVLRAAWRCRAALTAQAEAAPALSRAMAGDCTPVWEAEGWQQWLLPCTGKSDHAAPESLD